ncbi:MAG: hypothetical protein SGILL_005810 [Bacillariaceae sp.]
MEQPVQTSFNLTLGEIFSQGNAYLLDTRRNLRVYCWLVNDVVRLFSAIRDFDNENETVTLEIGRIELTESLPRHLTLQQKEFVGRQKGTQWFDVEDGQQRMTTIVVILRAAADELSHRHRTGKKEITTAHCATVEEIFEILNPKGAKRKQMSRLVSKTNIVMEMIKCDPWEENAARKKQRLSIEGDSKPVAHTSKQNASSCKQVPPSPEECIATAYDTATGLFEHMSADEIENFVENVRNWTSVVVSKWRDQSLAMRSIMHSRYGKNIEDVDYMKGILCRHVKDRIKTEVQTEVKWEELCRETSRQNVKDGCLIYAQIKTATLLHHDNCYGNDAIDFFQRYVDSAIAVVGSTNMYDNIKYAAKIKNDFDAMVSCSQENTTNTMLSNMEATLKAKAHASLRFLIMAVTAVSKRKDNDWGGLRTVVVAILMHGSTQGRVNLLRMLEPVAAWMVLVKPNGKSCRSIIRDILKQLKEVNNWKSMSSLVLSQERKEQLRLVLGTAEFDKSDKVAKGILERVNVANLHKNGTDMRLVQKDLFLDIIRPDADEKRNTKYKLGNLVAIATRPGRLGENVAQWEATKKRCKNSTFPLSMEVAEGWNGMRNIVEVVQRNTDAIMTTLDLRWKLKSRQP